MFNFLNHKATPNSRTIRQALVATGVSAARDRARVTIVETHGEYAGRRVTFFRATETGHPHHPLGSGHVEREGLVVVDGPLKTDDSTPPRQPANRADHADDEHLVFWDSDTAQSAVTTLSAPAATWLHARQGPDPASPPLG